MPTPLKTRIRTIASVYITISGYCVALFDSDVTDYNNKTCKLIDCVVSDKPSDKAIMTILKKYQLDGEIDENPPFSHVLINRSGGTENMIWKNITKEVFVLETTNPADLSIAINDSIITFSDNLKARVLREVSSITDESEIEHNHLVSSLLLGITDNNQVNKNSFIDPNIGFK